MSRSMTKPTKWRVDSKDSDQPGQISLGIHPDWSVFAVRLKKLESLATHRLPSELLPDCIAAQADLSLYGVHMLFYRFYHAPAQLMHLQP